MKGNNIVSTKKKVKLDKSTKVAKFDEKISLQTVITKDSNSNHYMSK